jgi:hypothetical protein
MKWNAVLLDLKLTASFGPYVQLLNVAQIQRKFDRMISIVEHKYSLVGEGSNLSGLPDECSDTEKCLYKMAVFMLKTASMKAEKKAKDLKRKTAMLAHETVILCKDNMKSEPLSDVSMSTDQSSQDKKRKYERKENKRTVSEEYLEMKRETAARRHYDSERIDKLTDDINDIKELLRKLVKNNDD